MVSEIAATAATETTAQMTTLTRGFFLSVLFHSRSWYGLPKSTSSLGAIFAQTVIYGAAPEEASEAATFSGKSLGKVSQSGLLKKEKFARTLAHIILFFKHPC